MAMFKVGVGYRLTPRTEAVVNFVYSRSAAGDEAIQIGTAGTSPQVPLKVKFTDYQYWGFEGGQRWFFSRVRFTPFVGWLVGLNRHQDIRGTFVGVPSERHTGPRRTGWQVLRKVVGVQPRTHRWRLDRGRAVRSDGRDATALPRRAVGRGLAGGGRAARCEQRELALVGAIALSARASGSRGLTPACSRRRPLQSRGAAAEAER